jgi:TonB-dependent receptor
LGRPIRISTDTAVRARAQYGERGAKAKKDFSDYYPSLNATFIITEKLVSRFAYARALGRPDLGDIIPGINITDPAAEGSARTITINDPGLKPWTGNNWDLSLEYYMKSGGLASVGVFRKDIKDFFGRTRSPATVESLAEFGLGEEFLDYDIIRNPNVGNARINGAEMSYRQELRFLPHWARGLQAFGNVTTLDLQGSNTADFDSFVRLSYSWGIGLTRPRFSVKLNWHERALQRRELITGALVPAETYRWIVPYRTLDLNAEYRIARKMSLYAVVRNVTNAVRPDQLFNAQTPAHARQRGLSNMPVALTLGMKGEF